MPFSTSVNPTSPMPPGCPDPRAGLRPERPATPVKLLTLALGLALTGGPGAAQPLVPQTPATDGAANLQESKPAEPVVRPAVADPVATSRELVLDRRRRQLVVLEAGLPLRRFPVAVGKPGWETPVGDFRVIEMIRDPVWEHPVNGQRIPPGTANPLGSRWIGFHRSCKGVRGPQGDGWMEVRGCVVAGFHGTPNRASIGRAASHGCVRLYDEDVRALFDLVQLGTPVRVMP